MRRAVEAKVGALAAAQLGLATYAQLRAAGVGRKSLVRGFEASRWVRMNRAVVKLTPGPTTLAQLELAAVLAAGPGAVLSHTSAARRLGLDVPQDRRIHVTVGAHRRVAAIEGARIWRARGLAADDVWSVGGLAVTGLGRTVLDLAPTLSDAWLRAVVDSALRLRPEHRQLIQRSLEQQGAGRPGARRLRRLLDAQGDADTISDSALESLAMELGLATGRKPRRQYPVQVDSGRVLRLDLAWPEVRLCVELDGFASHGTREAFERDRARDRALIRADWVVLRFAWRDVVAARQRTVDELRRAWEQRHASVARSGTPGSPSRVAAPAEPPLRPGPGTRTSPARPPIDDSGPPLGSPSAPRVPKTPRTGYFDSSTTMLRVGTP